MNTQELIDYLALGEKDAQELLAELDPSLERRFKRACNTLGKIVDEVRKRYPDANIYVQEDTPCLLIGESHSWDANAESHQEMVACNSHCLVGKIDGGGW